MALRILFIGNSFTFANDMPQQLADLATAAGGRGSMEFALMAPPGETLQGHWNTPSTRKAIRVGPWDYVVLQEQSTRPFEDPDAFIRYAVLLGRAVREAGTEPLLFLTWARRDQPNNQAQITVAYRRAAQEIPAIIVPVGLAWQDALKAIPSTGLYEPDGSHPNPSGSYLAACVFFAALLSKSPEGGPNNYGLADADARALQRIAWKTVIDERTAKDSTP